MCVGAENNPALIMTDVILNTVGPHPHPFPPQKNVLAKCSLRTACVVEHRTCFLRVNWKLDRLNTYINVLKGNVLLELDLPWTGELMGPNQWQQVDLSKILKEFPLPYSAF